MSRDSKFWKKLGERSVGKSQNKRYKGMRRGILTNAALGAGGAFVDDSRRASGGGAIVLRSSHGDGLRMSISELGQKKYNA